MHNTYLTLVLKFLIVTCIFTLLAACSATEEPEPPKIEVNLKNPMGFSGNHNPEAEKLYTLARILWKDSDNCSDPDLAISYLNKAIAIEPDYADAYLRRGMAKSDITSWDSAFDDLTKAIRLNPTPSNYAYRGLISMRMGNALGAKKDFDRSLSLDSKQHRAWNYRAALSLLKEDYEAACKDFAKGCSNGDCTGMTSAKEHGYCK